MTIDFFETEQGLDSRAVHGGVYQIELIKDGAEPICLYIGESVWISIRCGGHLYSLYEDPSYFGLTPDDLKDDKLKLKFSVLSSIEGKKGELGVGLYKEQELEAITEYKPLTQLKTSDRQIRNVTEKINIVQNKMFENGFKKLSNEGR